MRRPAPVLVATVCVLVGAVAGSAATSLAPAAPAGTPSLFAPPRQLVFYGHVRSLRRVGSAYRMRVDPAWWLGGATANAAAVQDHAISPGESVPNDYYIVDEGHRLLTYVVPAGAHVTVITNEPNCTCSTAITVAQLAQVVRGRNPTDRTLMEPRNGFWIRVATDTVRSLDQQYQP
jgi:hypothetical protein